MAKIAFIGLGNMGGPMAANLVKGQHQVTAFDLSAAALVKEGLSTPPAPLLLALNRAAPGYAVRGPAADTRNSRPGVGGSCSISENPPSG